MNHRWAEAAEKMLRDLAAGNSATDIANAINAKFGLSLTRNAVIGKAERLGIVIGRRPGRAKAKPCMFAPKTPAPRSISAPAPRKPSPEILREPIAPALAELAEAEVVIPVMGRVTLFGLRNDTCRWPAWRDGEPRLFCGAHGANFAAGRPYCAVHARAAKGAGTPSERGAIRAARAVAA